MRALLTQHVTEPLKADKTRRLILVAKLLQSLANEVEFDDKESFMLHFNSFFKDNIPKMRDLFDKILVLNCLARWRLITAYQITESGREKKKGEAHKKRSNFDVLASFLIKNSSLVVETMLNFPQEEVHGLMDCVQQANLIQSFSRTTRQFLNCARD